MEGKTWHLLEMTLNDLFCYRLFLYLRESSQEVAWVWLKSTSLAPL
jgi:hypothetical protein